MVYVPPDDLPANAKANWLVEWPKEPERDLDMLYLEFYAWLVVTGRLVGDTEPRPLGNRPWVDALLRVREVRRGKPSPYPLDDVAL